MVKFFCFKVAEGEGGRVGVKMSFISSLHAGRVHLSFDHFMYLTILVKYAYSTFLLSMSQVITRIEG